MEIVDCNASPAKEKKPGLFAKLLLKNNALFPGTKKEVVISEGIAECQQKIDDLTLLVRELMQQQQAREQIPMSLSVFFSKKSG